MQIKEIEKQSKPDPRRAEATPPPNTQILDSDAVPNAKTKSNKENISIKSPSLIQIRELLNEKRTVRAEDKTPEINYREKQINENSSQNKSETRISISKPSEDVIRLINESKKIAIKAAAEKPAGPPQKDKINVSPKESGIKLKTTINKDFGRPKPVSVNPIQESAGNTSKENNTALPPQKEVKRDGNNKIEFRHVRETENPAKGTESQNNLNKKGFSEPAVPTIAHNTEADAPGSRRPYSSDTGGILKKDYIPEETTTNLSVSSEQKETNTQKGIKELSSLSLEDRKNFFKIGRSKTSELFIRILPVSAGIILLIALFFIYNSLSGDSEAHNPLNQVAGINSGISGSQPVQERTDNSKKQKTQMQKNAEEISGTIETESEPELPPLPEIEGMIEPSASGLLGDSGFENSDSGKSGEGSISGPPKENKNTEDEPPFFVAVEQMPEPIGGLAEIQKRIVYPNIALMTGIEGKVYVKALVSESGIVTYAEVIKGLGAGCDEAAMEAVIQTRFKPGIQRGKPVKVQITIPVVFRKGK